MLGKVLLHPFRFAGGGNEALSSDGSNSSRKENVPPGVRGGGGGGLMICIDMNNTGNDSSEAEAAAMGHRDMGSRSSSSPQVLYPLLILSSSLFKNINNLLSQKGSTVVHAFNGHEVNGIHWLNGLKCYDKALYLVNK